MSTLHQILLDYEINEHEIDGACSTHGIDEKCVQNFGLKT
jgi:hypothetical protein